MIKLNKLIRIWPFFDLFLILLKLFSNQFLFKNWKLWSDSDHYFVNNFYFVIIVPSLSALRTQSGDSYSKAELNKMFAKKRHESPKQVPLYTFNHHKFSSFYNEKFAFDHQMTKVLNKTNDLVNHWCSSRI